MFKERDAARIVCRVVRAGGSKARIDQLFRVICKESPPQRKTAAEAALEAAIANIEANSGELDNAFLLFQIANGIMTLLFNVIPFLRLPGLVARLVARSRGLPPSVIEAQMANIVAQRASNDAMIRLLRQAAANEARFRLAAGE